MASIEHILKTAELAAKKGDSRTAVGLLNQLATDSPAAKEALWHAADGLAKLGQPKDAVAILQKGLERFPTSVSLLNLIAEVYLATDSPASALPYLERLSDHLSSQGIDPSSVEATINNIRERMENDGDLSSEITTLLNLAFAADQKRYYDEARVNYEAVLEQDPDNLLALSRLLTFDGIEGRLDEADKRHHMLVESASNADLDNVNWQQLGSLAYHHITRPLPTALYEKIIECIDRRLIDGAGEHKILKPARNTPRDTRLRIGYLSSFFRDHPVGHVTAGLFAEHDRNRFDVYVFYKPEGADTQYTEEIRAGAKHFITLTGSQHQIATTIAACDLDILIYIDGLMSLSLLPVVALRPAPRQVFWLGHAGSCNLSSIDHVIADNIVIPKTEVNQYRAKVSYLPDTYHCASPHPIAATMTRAEAGLPEKSFVFCVFNNPEKIDSRVFKTWMNILRRVDGSVLWISSTLNASVELNLRTAAAKYEIEGSRLVFAERIPDKSVHLARHKLADLFLDTITLNASTTALDALWSGLPVLTVHGTRFASRIATSHLNAVGLNDMVCKSLSEYEERAVDLGRNRAGLEDIKQRLSKNLGAYPLFQTSRFCANLERCLEAICDGRDR